jgi:DNA recombination protein RmuC
MVEVQGKLAGETQALGRALRTPQGRGQWGELQLRKVVEIAGMEKHCDFVEQQTIEADEGRLRPDLLVRLSGHKSVVVDSKVPLSAYLDAMEATEGSKRDAFLDRHARQVRDHVTALAAKDYASELAEAPDFVVLFLAGEAFFSAALSRDPGLLEFAVSKGVILASPTILIAVLKGIAYGWQQERIAENAEAIRDAGRTLYDRIQTVAGYFEKLRKGLESAVYAYNSAIGSIEGRVLPAARKLRVLDAGAGDEIATLEPIDGVPRKLVAAELSHMDATDTRLEVDGIETIKMPSNTHANAA